MAGQQSCFLATLTKTRKGSAVDPKSRKQKAPEGEKDPSRIKNKGNPPAQTTRKQVSTTPQPASDHQTAVVIPPSPDALPSPPPPPTTGVPRPILWESGVSNALSTTICPPGRFYDSAPYNEATIWELQTIELNAIKAASLTQTLASVQFKYGKTVDEFHICREDKNKTYEELLKVKEDYKTTNRDFLTLQQRHAENVKLCKTLKAGMNYLRKNCRRRKMLCRRIQLLWQIPGKNWRRQRIS